MVAPALASIGETLHIDCVLCGSSAWTYRRRVDCRENNLALGVLLHDYRMWLRPSRGSAFPERNICASDT